ncbi:MAG: acyltransferase family protein, partial [Phycisphaerales bacterium]
IVLHESVSYFAAPPGGEWPLRDPQRTGLAGIIVLGIHLFRMPAFFALSGFFAALVVSRKGLTAWVGDRVLRIGVPLVLGWLVLFPITKFAFVYANARAMVVTGDEQGAPRLIAAALADPWADPRPIHLWFLEFLLIFCGLGVAAWGVSRLIPAAARGAMVERSAAWVTGWRGVVTVALLTGATWVPMAGMRLPGIETPQSFIPGLSVVAVYAIYLFGGWALALNPRTIAALLGGAWWRCGAGALLAVLGVVLAIGWFVVFERGTRGNPGTARAFLIATQGVWAAAAWLLILGGAGVAERLIRESTRPVRFLAESSYFIYLVHLPVCVFVTGLLVPWEAPGALKLVCVLIASTALLCIGYWATRMVFPARRGTGS